MSAKARLDHRQELLVLIYPSHCTRRYRVSTAAPESNWVDEKRGLVCYHLFAIPLPKQLRTWFLHDHVLSQSGIAVIIGLPFLPHPSTAERGLACNQSYLT